MRDYKIFKEEFYTQHKIGSLASEFILISTAD